MRGLVPKPKSGFRVLHEVSELGLGARVARTRLRLVAITALTTVFYVAYARLSADFMREGSTSVALNLVLITGSMLLILVTAFIQALLVGDLLFPGRWRERVILGKKVEVSDDEAIEREISKFKDFTLPFYGVCALLLLFNYLLLGWMTGGFLSEYHVWRYQQTLLRSGDPESQIRGIRNVVNPRNAEAQDVEAVRSSLITLASEGDREVQGWAIWALGEIQVFEGAAELRRLVADQRLPDELRARAAESLGVVAQREGAELMAGLLTSAFGRDELALGLLRGLGLAGVQSTAHQITPLLNVEPTEIRAHAFWALGHTRNPEYREAMRHRIEEGTTEDRCFAAEAMKFMATPDDLVTAHTWFASADMTPCQAVVWTRPYHWRDDLISQTEIIVGESLRAKFLKVVFTAGGYRERDFFAALAHDEDQPAEIRALARELALRIDHRR